MIPNHFCTQLQWFNICYSRVLFPSEADNDRGNESFFDIGLLSLGSCESSWLASISDAGPSDIIA